MVGININKFNILTVNVGSSSVKISLLSSSDNLESVQKIIDISIANIGQALSTLTTKDNDNNSTSKNLVIKDHDSAINLIKNWLKQSGLVLDISAVGHRIVHGGPKYNQPELLTDDIISDLESYIDYDPEHLPGAIRFIREFGSFMPEVPQVACFDTAFFHDLPILSQIIPIASRYQDLGLRRYGFHGLSYSYLQDSFAKLAGDTAVKGLVIYAHLGSGSRLTATVNARPIDSTMGFTPNSGIIMSTRSGDIDSGIYPYLQNRYGLNIDEIQKMTNDESGLLAVSDFSSDMYKLLQNESSNKKAADAVNLFVYQVKKSIGAFAAALGGLDSLIFSGGIGEKSPIIRSRICEGLGFLGVNIDENNNNQQAFLISDNLSRIGVHVIATDEATTIYRQVVQLLTNKTGEQ